MKKLSVKEARGESAIGQTCLLQGWVRTRRDSKAGFSFIELNDGSSQGNIQVIADKDLPNYSDEIQKLTIGCSITVDGEVKDDDSASTVARCFNASCTSDVSR